MSFLKNPKVVESFSAVVSRSVPSLPWTARDQSGIGVCGARRRGRTILIAITFFSLSPRLFPAGGVNREGKHRVYCNKKCL